MPPVTPETSFSPPSRLARNLFWRFLLLSLVPLAAAVALGFAFLWPGIFTQPLYMQWRWLLSAAGLALLAAGIIWLLTRRIGRQPSELLHQMRQFMAGNWEQRAEVHGGDDFAQLAQAFNCLADDLSESHHLLMIRDQSEQTGRQAAAALLAQGSLAAGSRSELLRAALDLFLHHFGCTFGAIYLLESGPAAGSTYLSLEQTAGALGAEGETVWLPLAERFEEKRINLDATPTMDWLIGKAIATRRPQVGPATPDSYVYEAVLPLTLAGAGGTRLIGVVDLLTGSRVKDARLGPFAIRAVAEMQTAACVLALSITAFDPRLAESSEEAHPGVELPARGGLRLSSSAVYTFSTRIAQAQTREQVLEAVRQAMRTVGYASVALVRPAQPEADSPLQVLICRQLRTQRPGMNEPALVLPGPRLSDCEAFFQQNSGSPLLLYDLDQPGEHIGSDAPPELEAIARRMGCRSAAFLPAVQDERLTAILMVGAAPEVPAPLVRGEALQPFSNLVGLAASAIERIHAQNLTQRKLADMESLWQFTQTVSQENDLEALVVRLHEQVQRVAGELNSFAVGLYDSQADTIRFPYLVENGKRMSVPAFPLGQGLTSAVISGRKPILLRRREDVETQTQASGTRRVGDAAMSWLGVPMIHSGEVVGVIVVQDTLQEDRFSEDDAELLSTLAAQVAGVVRNARLLEVSRQQARQERLVNEISDRIRRGADMQAILKTTADELGQALNLRRAEIHIRPNGESDKT